jgi:hypothetical protein
MIGETMFVSGIAMFITAPIVGRLMQKVDMRSSPPALRSSRSALADDLDHQEYDFYELLVPQILRGIGMMTIVADQHHRARALPPDRVKNASGLFNLAISAARSGSRSSTRCSINARPAHRGCRKGELGQRHRHRNPQHVHPAHAGHGRRG